MNMFKKKFRKRVKFVYDYGNKKCYCVQWSYSVFPLWKDVNFWGIVNNKPCLQTFSRESAIEFASELTLEEAIRIKEDVKSKIVEFEKKQRRQRVEDEESKKTIYFE